MHLISGRFYVKSNFSQLALEIYYIEFTDSNTLQNKNNKFILIPVLEQALVEALNPHHPHES